MLLLSDSPHPFTIHTDLCTYVPMYHTTTVVQAWWWRWFLPCIGMLIRIVKKGWQEGPLSLRDITRGSPAHMKGLLKPPGSRRNRNRNRDEQDRVQRSKIPLMLLLTSSAVFVNSHSVILSFCHTAILSFCQSASLPRPSITTTCLLRLFDSNHSYGQSRSFWLSSHMSPYLPFPLKSCPAAINLQPYNPSPVFYPDAYHLPPSLHQTRSVRPLLPTLTVKPHAILGVRDEVRRRGVEVHRHRLPLLDTSTSSEC